MSTASSSSSAAAGPAPWSVTKAVSAVVSKAFGKDSSSSTPSAPPSKTSESQSTSTSQAGADQTIIKTPPKPTTQAASSNTVATAPSTAPTNATGSGMSDDMFSPTSAAALALSTLVHGNSGRSTTSAGPHRGGSAQAQEHLSRTRLFPSSTNGKKASLRKSPSPTSPPVASASAADSPQASDAAASEAASATKQQDKDDEREDIFHSILSYSYLFICKPILQTKRTKLVKY